MRRNLSKRSFDFYILVTSCLGKRFLMSMSWIVYQLGSSLFLIKVFRFCMWRWNKNHYQAHQLFHNCIFDSDFVENSDLGFGFLFKILGVLFWSSYVAKRLLVGIGSSWVWWYVFIFVFREDLWFFPLFFAIRSEKTLTQPPKIFPYTIAASEGPYEVSWPVKSASLLDF